jgi:hypothetical protein
MRTKNTFLANYPSICMLKAYGWLGIPNLQDHNGCLLESSIKKYIKSKGSMCKKFMLSMIQKSQTSCDARMLIHFFWNGVL